jgi:hypothetical protein
MEDVLEVYHRPYQEACPLVCLDETTKQLVGEVRDPLPLRPGDPAAQDTHYKRNGVATLFMMTAPLEGFREVRVTEGKTRIDYALCLQWLAEEKYPDAEKIVLVQDQLNTHHPASLYEAFAPAKARDLIGRFEFHYTPKHGSWLNIAEIELSILSRQCLDRRIAKATKLISEVAAWCHYRNTHLRKINWQMTTNDARIKLQKLYPSYDVA